MATLAELDDRVARYENGRERERRMYLVLRSIGIEGSAAHAIVKGHKPWPELARQLRDDGEAANHPPVRSKRHAPRRPIDLTPWVSRDRTRRALRGA